MGAPAETAAAVSRTAPEGNFQPSPLKRHSSAHYKLAYHDNRFDRVFSRGREVAFALHDAARMLRTYSDQRARELNTTRAQWAVLVAPAALRRGQAERTRRGARHRADHPRPADRQARRGRAGRAARRPADRRAHRLYLTDKAIPALSALGALAEDVMGRALAGLDDATDRDDPRRAWRRSRPT